MISLSSMKWVLAGLALLVIASMSWITIVASLDRGVFEAGRELWPDPWFRATLMDAYFGFLTFYVWIAYKERRWLTRIGWLIAVLGLGNFAMSGYLLWQLSKLDTFSWEALLLRREPACRND